MTHNTGAVMLLTASYEPLGNIEFPKAVSLMFRNAAVVVEGDETRRIGPHPWPKVLRLVRYVYEKWLDRPARWHRGGVFIRDNHKCAYCGAPAKTIDHIVPQSKGGEWSWTNCVSACGDCNGRKGNRSLAELGWTLKYATPYVPTVRELHAKARA